MLRITDEQRKLLAEMQRRQEMSKGLDSSPETKELLLRAVALALEKFDSAVQRLLRQVI